ncbi:MAG: DsbA family oxidoreductase [Rhodobacterales bacterium]|nr:DsbA family oxidoreductase [Rhodobacterales bacterium]
MAPGTPFHLCPPESALVKLDILSDPICPWCYVGKANLYSALERAPDHPFVIEWHPFQLNPDMPREGRDRRAYMAERFGGHDKVAAAEQRVQQFAKAAGLAINFDAMERIPNTIDAHRLVHWAGIEGKQSPVVSALFRANFVEGRDISDPEVLADIADWAGLDASVVSRLLSTDADVAEIQVRDAHSRRMGVNAVPTFIVAQQHAVPGAQPPEMWDRIIADIQAKLAGGTAS